MTNFEIHHVNRCVLAALTQNVLSAFQWLAAGTAIPTRICARFACISRVQVCICSYQFNIRVCPAPLKTISESRSSSFDPCYDLQDPKFVRAGTHKAPNLYAEAHVCRIQSLTFSACWVFTETSLHYTCYMLAERTYTKREPLRKQGIP